MCEDEVDITTLLEDYKKTVLESEVEFKTLRLKVGALEIESDGAGTNTTRVKVDGVALPVSKISLSAEAGGLWNVQMTLIP